MEHIRDLGISPIKTGNSSLREVQKPKLLTHTYRLKKDLDTLIDERTLLVHKKGRMERKVRHLEETLRQGTTMLRYKMIKSTGMY